MTSHGFKTQKIKRNVLKMDGNHHTLIVTVHDRRKLLAKDFKQRDIVLINTF